MHKNFKRALCAVALAGVAGAVPVLSGCTSDYPEAKITIAFNGTEYVLEYTMSRKLYPQTVQHFIELADNDFYNDTIIHNYTSSYWYGGAYAYSAEEYKTDFADSAMDDYFENYSKERAYYTLAEGNKLTPTVYREYIDGSYKEALATLIGEFGETHVIDNDTGLRGSYGALRMFYTDKDTKQAVYLDKLGNDEPLIQTYGAHSATSLFSIQLSSSTTKDSKYCIFATLKNTEELEELTKAIDAYKSNSDNAYSGSKFTATYNDVYVDYYDAFIQPRVNTADYVVTGEPLVIKSVDVTKY